MHPKPPGGLGDVAVALLEHPLDMLPPNAIRRHRIVRRWRQRPVAVGQKRGLDLVGVGRLGDVVDRTGLHRGHGRGDVAVSGQDHDPRIRPPITDHRHQIKAVAVFDAQIEDGEGRADVANNVPGVAQARHRDDVKAAFLHRPRQSVSERRIVVEDQQTARG